MVASVQYTAWMLALPVALWWALGRVLLRHAV